MTGCIDVEMTGDTRLELFPVRVMPDGAEFIVGRPATGTFLALSGAALAAIDLLRAGRTIADTKKALGAPALGVLLDTLLGAGLVKSVDGVPLPPVVPARRYHLTFIRSRHVGWMFSRAAGMAAALVVAAGAAILAMNPRYFPRPSDLLVVPDPWLNLLLFAVVSLFSLAAHELAHFAAATFLGVQASFALSHRLFFPVAQTDLTDLWLVDRRRRYLAYVAGIVNDVVLASGALIALWLADHGGLPLTDLIRNLLRLAVLVLLCGVLWQFNFYLRTDVYYVVANATGCRNLSADATAFLKARLARMFAAHHPDPLERVPARERGMVRAFAILMVVGGTLALGVAALYLVGFVILLFAAPASLHGASLASVSIVAGWLAIALVAGHRRRRRLRYRLVAPDGL